MALCLHLGSLETQAPLWVGGMSKGEPASTGTSPVCGGVRFPDSTTADRRVRGPLGIWKDGAPGPLPLAAAQLPVGTGASATGDLSCECGCSWVVCACGLSCCGQKAGTAHTHSTVSTGLSPLVQSTHL